MKLRTRVDGLTLNDLENRRIGRRLDRLGRRLADWPDPIVTLLLAPRPAPPGVAARVRVRSGHLGGHLVSRASAETADQAVGDALSQVIRQLERRQAGRRGEPTFGVPSRREPAELRPAARAEPESPTGE